MATLPEIEELRHRFLQKLYDLSGASIHKEVPLEQVELEAAIPPNITTELILYLSQKRLIELRIKKICITAGGIYEIERKNQKSAPPGQIPPAQIINIHGPNYGGIQQGGQGNAQLTPSAPRQAKKEESVKKTDEESANKLYDQVIEMSNDWNSVDEAKAQLIIEYSKDAIEAFGKTNQAKKVELRRIIEKAEHIISPDSIDTVKKRAERVVLRLVYPKNPKIRNIFLLLVGTIIILTIVLPFIFNLWGLREKFGISNTSSPIRKRVVLIFADTTSSLTPKENGKVARLTADIVDSLPVNTVFAVYPIQRETQRIAPIIPPETIPKRRGVLPRPVEKEEDENRRNFIQSRIINIYGTTLSRPQTCILNILWFAQEQFARMSDPPRLDPSIYDYELIFISDMAENCEDSPLGRINLNKQNIFNEIDLTSKFSIERPAPDLSNTRITVIFPLSIPTPESNDDPDLYKRPLQLPRPNDIELREFWRRIFKRCGFKDEWFWDNIHIEWIPNGELPNSFKTTKP